MRLLHTRDLTFEEFIGRNIPKYAILSHTWVEGEEVSFHEWQHPTERTKGKSGYQKILSAATQARADKYDWVWVDTSSIDKRSSAELQEAINSMFKWYKNAGVCYAYLRDVESSDAWSDFEKSRWFARGWTLQELIAPYKLIFFTKNWKPVGRKDELANLVSHITGIPFEVLSRTYTLRVEDMAYCLFGIFGVNLPLLYGEGEKAFRRLQEEILSNEHDHSLFAWTLDPNTERPETYYMGLLAPSPHNFQGCGDIVDRVQHLPKPYSKTNLGLSISLPLTQVENSSEPDFFIGTLNCWRVTKDGRRHTGIFLKKLMQDMYARVDPTILVEMDSDDELEKLEQNICIPNDIDKFLPLHSKPGTTDCSRICGMTTVFPYKTESVPSIQVEPSSLIVRSSRDGQRTRFSLDDYVPDKPIGAIRFTVDEVRSPISLTLVFGHSVSDCGQKEIWFAEIPFWETDWEHFRRALERSNLSKRYPERASNYERLSSFVPWSLFGRLGLYASDQLYYLLYIKADRETF